MTTIQMHQFEYRRVRRNFISAHMQKYPFIFSDEWKYRFGRHLAFWLFWGVFQGFLYSFIASKSIVGYVKQLPVSMMESFIFLVAHIFLAYSLMYFVIPRFLLKQKYRQTAVWTLACFIITAFISTFIGRFIIDPLRAYIIGDPYVLSLYRVPSLNIHLSLMAGLRGGITVGGIAAAIKLMKHWYIKEQRNLQLQKENIESQLQLLKAQVHPHFLFNTLNNIYSYTQKTSPVAAKMVSGLSDLLRFMLYEGDQRVVPLSKELKMVQDYIGLEQIRYGNKPDIHLDLPENTNDLYIAPLLLLPLVENCFKHGTSNMLEQPWISLKLTLNDNDMRMKLINGRVVESNDQKKTHGIGIANVQKRLSLLYPGKHEFVITSDAEVFVVNLKIELEQRKEQVSKPLAPQQRLYA
ncbi:MAG TPA: histidine kinase [Chitinophagaceae bacterium]|nr:histidine kinase [Chitinophagaceae bacterium]